MTKKPIFRVIFHCGAEIIEIHANQVFQSELWGFLEVESFVMEDSIIQQNEIDNDKIKKIFTGVKRSYIPLTSIVRIDEVEKIENNGGKLSSIKRSNVKPFPLIPR